MATTKDARDLLGNIGDRQSLMGDLHDSLAQARLPDKTVALMVVKGGCLNRINDSLGVAAGDQVISEIAQRLRGFVSQSMILVRLHADTFACVVINPDSREAVIDQAKFLLGILARPLLINDETVSLVPRLGVAFFPQDADTPADLLLAAEYALQVAKHKFLTPCQQFDFVQYQLEKRHLKIITALNELMDNGVNDQLEIYYQPKVCLHSRKIMGAEALLRWNNPKLGQVSPSEFIPLVENTSLGIRLDRWVLLRVIEQQALWIQQGFDLHQIAVNLSTAQLIQVDLPEWLSTQMRYWGLPFTCLQLEITEGTIIANDHIAYEVLLELRSQGFSLALDDFGTGYSSLSYLSKLPLDELKIDRTFLIRIEQCERTLKLLGSIVMLAKSLDLDLVVEGVETAEQLELLLPMGPMKIQGYYFYRPMKAGEFIQMLNHTDVSRN